jgi:hypothetical protein
LKKKELGWQRNNFSMTLESYNGSNQFFDEFSEPIAAERGGPYDLTVLPQQRSDSVDGGDNRKQLHPKLHVPTAKHSSLSAEPGLPNTLTSLVK